MFSSRSNLRDVRITKISISNCFKTDIFSVYFCSMIPNKGQTKTRKMPKHAGLFNHFQAACWTYFSEYAEPMQSVILCTTKCLTWSWKLKLSEDINIETFRISVLCFFFFSAISKSQSEESAKHLLEVVLENQFRWEYLV